MSMPDRLVRLVPVLSLLSLGACAGPDSTDGKPSTDGNNGDDTAPTTTTSPCADGTWGPLDDPALAIHVRTDGDDANLGGGNDPVASIAAAMTLMRLDVDIQQIFMGPGTFAGVGPGEGVTSVSFESDDGGGNNDDGAAFLGCSVDETTVESAASGEPVLKVSGTQNLVLSDFGVSGGRRAIWIWQGAGVELNNIRVSESRRVGIVVDGNASIVTANNVEVREVVAERTSGSVLMGYGISVQQGTFNMNGGGIYDATRAGLLADFAHIDLQGITVQDTQSADDVLGRGVQFQELSVGNIDGANITGNHDAGVFALRAVTANITNVTVDGTLASEVPETQETTGDGIVVTRGDSDVGVENFQATVTGNRVSGSERAGILLAGVTVLDLSSNTLTDNGYAPSEESSVAQDGADITGGSDDFYDVDAAGVAPLSLNDELVDTDDLQE